MKIKKVETAFIDIPTTDAMVRMFVEAAKNAPFTGNETGNGFPVPNWRIRHGLKVVLESLEIQVGE
jgi:hypothetical protein